MVAPGIIDNHTHYDAQVTWDPLCTYSCYHGVTTVVIGNCSLALAPAHKEDRDNLAGVLSHVEAIPLEAIQAGVKWSWETIPQYLDALDQRLGLNVASLIGHSAVRRYVMGEASQERHATEEEIAAMKAIVREGIEAGAVGVSFERNPRHFDWDGRLAPTNLAADSEIFAVAGVIDEVGRGVIQFGGDRKLGTEVAKTTRLPRFLWQYHAGGGRSRPVAQAARGNREPDAPGASRLSVRHAAARRPALHAQDRAALRRHADVEKRHAAAAGNAQGSFP